MPCQLEHPRLWLVYFSLFCAFLTKFCAFLPKFCAFSPLFCAFLHRFCAFPPSFCAFSTSFYAFPPRFCAFAPMFFSNLNYELPIFLRALVLKRKRMRENGCRSFCRFHENNHALVHSRTFFQILQNGQKSSGSSDLPNRKKAAVKNGTKSSDIRLQVYKPRRYVWVCIIKAKLLPDRKPFLF